MFLRQLRKTKNPVFLPSVAVNGRNAINKGPLLLSQCFEHDQYDWNSTREGFVAFQNGLG